MPNWLSKKSGVGLMWDEEIYNRSIVEFDVLQFKELKLIKKNLTTKETFAIAL